MSDLIDRQKAIDALKAKAVPLYKDPGCNDIWERDRTLDNAIDVIRGLPSAQPERKTGRWTKAYDGYDGHVSCTSCFKIYDWDSQAQYYNYCPNCGSYNGGGA